MNRAARKEPGVCQLNRVHRILFLLHNRRFARQLVFAAGIAICLWTIGCTATQRLSFHVINAVSRQPIDGVSVRWTTITGEHLVTGPDSESHNLGQLKGSVLEGVQVSPKDIVEFLGGDTEYYRTRVQVSGRAAWTLSDAVPEARQYGFWETILRGDPFERERATRQEIGRDGVVVVPLVQKPRPKTTP